MGFGRPRLTLPRFFAVVVVGGLALLAGLVLMVAVRTAGRAVIATGEAARQMRASQVAGAVEADLGVAARAMGDFERALGAGVVDARDAESLRRYLTSELIALRTLTDLTLTTGSLQHYDVDGNAVLATNGRRQISLFRDQTGALGQRLIADVTPPPGVSVHQ